MEPEIIHLRELVTQRLDTHDQRHGFERQAVDRAAELMNARLEKMNEFRAQLDRQATLFVTRDFLDGTLVALTTGIEKDVAELTRRLEKIEGRLDLIERNAANQAGRLWAAGVVIGFTFTLLSLFLKFFVP